jgi:hypothetical protein
MKDMFSYRRQNLIHLITITYMCIYSQYSVCNEDGSYCIMLGSLDQFWSPIVPCFATEDAVRVVNSFITIFTYTSLQSLTIISYAVSHLHSLQSYTFVTKITYYTLTLADFSAINYCLKLSHTVAHAKSSIHTANRLRYLLRKSLAEILLRQFTS